MVSVGYPKEMTRGSPHGPQALRLSPDGQDFVHTWLACGKFASSMPSSSNTAIRSYKNVLRFDPANITALHGLATAALSKKDHREIFETTEILNSALTSFFHIGKEVSIWFDLASCYLELADYDTANRVLVNTLKTAGSCPSIWLLYSRLLSRTNMINDSLDAYQRTIRLASASSRNINILRIAHTEIAALFMTQNNTRACIQELVAAISLPPPAPDKLKEYSCTWGLLALAHREAGDLPAALSACVSGLDVVGQNMVLRLLQSHLLLTSENPREHLPAVIFTLHRVIETQERNAITCFLSYYLLARSYFLQDNPSEAYKYFREALNCEPKSPLLWLSMGHLYLHLNQLNDSMEAYSQVIKFEAADPQITTAMAWEGLKHIYERCEDQSQDAIDACMRASACYRSCDRPDLAAQMDSHAANLKSGKRNSLTEISDVPQWLVGQFLWEQCYEKFQLYSSPLEFVIPPGPDPRANHANSTSPPRLGHSPTQSPHSPLSTLIPHKYYEPQMMPVMNTMVPSHPHQSPPFYVGQQPPVQQFHSSKFQPPFMTPVYPYPQIVTGPLQAPMHVAEMNFN
ncbi:hypothetical protein OGAPHI_004028 [Ogataea philodendri]|uniref:Uncharacterized protein n=1 Tax=Ogataea philodendri TaxID=1378263 RepID=A0A9P8T584_9ASCO|nr:uncharacterized protein OGAPHI_004028 [Ogataea philodendri]KAH3665840.1 hypothetical protein OGAPHI_004028 [Ogataea philodendri]